MNAKKDKKSRNHYSKKKKRTKKTGAGVVGGKCSRLKKANTAENCEDQGIHQRKFIDTHTKKKGKRGER